MLRIGCHLSSSKGFLAMGRQAVEIGANTFQFFTRNPRGGAVKPLDPEDAAAYAAFAAENGVGPIVAHAPYTVNPCAAVEKTRDFAFQVFNEDLAKLQSIPDCYYNFHPGSHVGQGMEEGIRLIADLLNTVIKPEQRTIVLLETMAGKGTEVGGRFEHLREIIDRVELTDHIGVCLDTCHINDGGYDVVNDFDGVMAEFDRVVGLSRLRAIHMNDSKNPFGSHKDRHEVIGGGHIGLEAMVRVLRHPAVKGLPVVLETPNEIPGYAAEIALLRREYQAAE